MKKLLAAILIAIVVLAMPLLAYGAPGDIRVFVNGAEVEFGESKPLIRNARAIAPARSVFGSVGAEIAWDAQNKKVSVTIDGRTLELWEGIKQVKYSTSEGSKRINIDAAPEIINETIYVPLSIIAETLGGQVEWNDAERAAYFTFVSSLPGSSDEEADDNANEASDTPNTANTTDVTEEAPADEEQVSPAHVDRKGEYDIDNLPMEMIISGFKVSVGDTLLLAEKNFGKYSYQNRSIYGYEWQEINYGKDKYAMLGAASGNVVALYTNSKDISVAGITPGMSAESLNAAVGTALERESKSKIISDKGIITVYRSSIDDFAVIAVMAQKTGFTAPDILKITNSFYDEPTERQLAGIINTERLNRGLTPLKLDDTLSRVAKEHSAAMAEGNYLSETDGNGQSPFERMEAAGMTQYEMASENVGRDVMDAIEMYYEWMNDRSYAANLMDEHYNYMGVGVSPCPNNHNMYFTVDLIAR